MFRRVLNVYFIREPNTLTLRFIEMQRIDEEQERRDREIPEYWRRMQELRKPRFARVCPAIHDQLNYEYIGYTASRVYAHNTQIGDQFPGREI